MKADHTIYDETDNSLFTPDSVRVKNNTVVRYEESIASKDIMKLEKSKRTEFFAGMLAHLEKNNQMWATKIIRSFLLDENRSKYDPDAHKICNIFPESIEQILGDNYDPYAEMMGSNATCDCCGIFMNAFNSTPWHICSDCNHEMYGIRNTTSSFLADAFSHIKSRKEQPNQVNDEWG